MRASALEKIKKHTGNTMDKQRLRLHLTVLEAVKTQYPDTKQFIDDLIDEEC